MTELKVRQIATIMEPEPGNPFEQEGVLNPASARGRDGALYLFPRLVGKGNYSRIGIARVKFNAAGDPAGVERLGIVLEPEAEYELGANGSGGCEDPRVTFIQSLQKYVMSYVALSSLGPRVALAISDDLMSWRRIGLAEFSTYHGVDFDDVDDKDAVIFPQAVTDPLGQPALAILHRPHFTGDGPQTSADSIARAADLDRKSIWISYCSLPGESGNKHGIGAFRSHRPLASPVEPWERIKIGGGTPPILTRCGWLIVYHGVAKVPIPNGQGAEICYSAGLMLLAKDDPRMVSYRTKWPILTLDCAQEQSGVKGNVVFPTGIDRRDDIGQPDRFDIYYGMGDTRIGVASFNLPRSLQ
jgi:predicted GH43/DUF377 family glycosyl hydrolase